MRSLNSAICTSGDPVSLVCTRNCSIIAVLASLNATPPQIETPGLPMRSFLFFDLKMLAHTPQTHQAQFCTLKSRRTRQFFNVSGYKIHTHSTHRPPANTPPQYAALSSTCAPMTVAATLLSPVRSTTVGRCTPPASYLRPPSRRLPCLPSSPPQFRTTHSDGPSSPSPRRR